jgi:hypothetical protein
MKRRKRIPKNKLKKNVTICLPPHVIDKLKQDEKKGKAVTFNKMAAKIIIKYYKKIEEKEKTTEKKAA